MTAQETLIPIVTTNNVEPAESSSTVDFNAIAQSISQTLEFTSEEFPSGLASPTAKALRLLVASSPERPIQDVRADFTPSTPSPNILRKSTRPRRSLGYTFTSSRDSTTPPKPQAFSSLVSPLVLPPRQIQAQIAIASNDNTSTPTSNIPPSQITASPQNNTNASMNETTRVSGSMGSPIGPNDSGIQSSFDSLMTPNTSMSITITERSPTNSPSTRSMVREKTLTGSLGSFTLSLSFPAALFSIPVLDHWSIDPNKSFNKCSTLIGHVASGILAYGS